MYSIRLAQTYHEILPDPVTIIVGGQRRRDNYTKIIQVPVKNKQHIHRCQVLVELVELFLMMT